MTAVHEWWSQPYRPDGAATGDGIGKQLDAAELDPLVVLLRETAQNSWDARVHETSGISLRYDVERLGVDRSTAFKGVLAPGVPRSIESFDDAVGPDAILLTVSDRGTSGLGGPTRSDARLTEEHRDFVNFVRNVGEPRDRELGGGTYGFGKGAFYRVSRAATVVIDTACVADGRVQRRLMAAVLGHRFEKDGLPHTGRHWWGTVRDGVIEPLLDDEAFVVGQELGMGGCATGETGTDVYILGGLLGEDGAGNPRSCAAAATVIASAALWYLWPKLTRRGDRPRLDLTITADGVEIAVPDPSDVPSLRPFVEALAAIDAGRGAPHGRRRPARNEGSYAVDKDIYINRHDAVVAAVAPFEGPAHHCALMRHVELVVDYLEGQPLPEPYQYGAVFRSANDKSVDECFAAAEPPTHDQWRWKPLSGEQRGTVERALKFVRARLNEVVAPAVTTPSGGNNVPTGGLSHALAGALAGASGDGGSPPSGSGGAGGGGGGRGTSSAVRLNGAARLELRDGVALVAQGVRFGSAPSVAEAAGVVAVDGGTEREAPEGAPVPAVVGWSSDGVWVEGPRIELAVGDPVEWTVYVRPAGDSATVVRVREVKQ